MFEAGILSWTKFIAKSFFVIFGLVLIVNLIQFFSFYFVLAQTTISYVDAIADKNFVFYSEQFDFINKLASSLYDVSPDDISVEYQTFDSNNNIINKQVVIDDYYSYGSSYREIKEAYTSTLLQRGDKVKITVTVPYKFKWDLEFLSEVRNAMETPVPIKYTAYIVCRKYYKE